MPYYSGYGMAAGHMSTSAYNLAANVRVEDWTRQADMTTSRVWMRPDNTSDVVSPVAEYVESLDGKRYGYGRAEFSWKFRALSPLMVAYIKSTFFSGGYSAPVTVRTFNRSTGSFEIYNAIARLPDVRNQAEPAAKGFDNYEVQFVMAVLAPSTNSGFSSGFSTGFGPL